MNYLSVFMTVFSVIGAVDRIFGNKFRLGDKFEKGILFLGTLVISMSGMISLAPVIAELIKPLLSVFENTLHIDPSVITASIFANDMGGAPLSVKVAMDSKIGLYNALVVSSMMGTVISFNIPFALGVVKKEHHNDMFFGFLCGVVTIPIGCFVSGIMLGIGLQDLFKNLLVIIIIAVVLAIGLLKCPKVCIKIFELFGKFVRLLITLGLACSIVKFLTGFEIIKNLDSLENGVAVCLNASAVMTGAFVFIEILSRILKKPLKKLGKLLGINEVAALGFVSTLATNVTTFEMLNRMDKKGITLNSAFATSAAFVFGGHLAFTMAFNQSYVFPVIVGKLISGILAFLLAVLLYNRNTNEELSEKV